MIRSLRRWHGRIWALLAPGVALGLLASVLTRSPEGDPPREAEGLPAAVVWSSAGSAPAPKLSVLDDETPVLSEERAFGDPGGAIAVFQRGDRFVAKIVCDRCAADHPDPVLYWAPAVPGDALPADARLLGGVLRGASTFALPVQGAAPAGVLILYSLGHGAIVGRVPLGGAP